MKTFYALLVSATALAGGYGATAAQAEETKKAIFAGGCFWCVEKDFDHVPGVLKTISGYIGGNTDSPTYQNHSAGRHREAVEITYDPEKVTYTQLLNVFWRSVDPTDAGGQFCDRGHSYTTAIYGIGEEQLKQAAASKEELETSGVLKAPVAISVEEAGIFWPAEDYHQDYYKKNPTRYKLYRFGCGRDRKVVSVWGDQAHAGIAPH
ncbi:MAG: peptide-methionine (S)-S-oxide reductase MsrA [Pseudomonadota bacterium]